MLSLDVCFHHWKLNCLIWTQPPLTSCWWTWRRSTNIATSIRTRRGCGALRRSVPLHASTCIQIPPTLAHTGWTQSSTSTNSSSPITSLTSRDMYVNTEYPIILVCKYSFMCGLQHSLWGVLGVTSLESYRTTRGHNYYQNSFRIYSV